MNGTVLSYNMEQDAGVIRGDDGSNYIFGWKDWLSRLIQPEAGHVVSFTAAGSTAVKISINK